MSSRQGAFAVTHAYVPEGVTVRMSQSLRAKPKIRKPITTAIAFLGSFAVVWSAAGASPSLANDLNDNQFEAEFSEPAEGAPDGWSSLWNEGDWSTVGEDPTALRHVIEYGDTENLRRALTFDEPGDAGIVEGDVEVHAVMRVPGELGPTTRFGLGLQLDGEAGSENGLYLDVNGTTLRLNQYEDGEWSQLGSAHDLQGFEGGVWYNAVLRQHGDSLLGKFWAHGQDEPLEWQVEATGLGAEEPNLGRVGVFNAHEGGESETAYFSVGVAGEEAPRADADLIPEPDYDPLLTGFENRDGESWTTHEEELDFLAAVDGASDRVRVSEIASSANGLPINLVSIGNPAPPSDEEIAAGRSILVIGTQHGNEPAGQEMTLQLIRNLALTDEPELLEQLADTTIMVIPTMNPDGRIANIRQLASGLDMNRDHLELTSVEAQTMAQVIRDMQPDVIVDAHEKPTTLTGADLDALWPRNLAIDPTLRELSTEMVEDYIFADLEAAGISTAVYGGEDPGGAGDENEGIARNMFGLRHSAAVLIETPGLRVGTERVEYQMAAMDAVLRFQRENADRIEQVTNDAPINREADGLNQEPFYLFGADNDPPLEENTLDPAPCAYVLTPEQAAEVEHVLDFYGVQVQTGDGEVHVSMAQPMMTVVPFILDAGARSNLVEGTAVFDAAECPLGTIENVTAPAIAGDTEAGQTLTADAGTWNPEDVELSYQWLADGEPVEGATGSTFELTESHEGQMISVTVTGEQDRYEGASATSDEVGPVTVEDDGSEDPGDEDPGDEDDTSGTGELPETGSASMAFLAIAALLLLMAGATVIARKRLTEQGDVR